MDSVKYLCAFDFGKLPPILVCQFSNVYAGDVMMAKTSHLRKSVGMSQMSEPNVYMLINVNLDFAS